MSPSGDYWRAYTAEQKEVAGKVRSEGMLRYHASLTEEEKKSRNMLISKSISETLAAKSVYEHSLTLEKLKCVGAVSKRTSLSWMWLAGFLQAEGSFGYKGITLGQKDREPLDLIKQFLEDELLPLKVPSVNGPYKNGKSFIYSLTLSSMYVRTKIFARILSYTYSIKQPIKCVCLPITWEWLGGFWEGDGSITSVGVTSGSSGTTLISFTQKDVVVLRIIQAFLRKGKIYKFLLKNVAYYNLVVNESHKTSVIAIELLQHVKSYRRSMQIMECLYVSKLPLARTESELLSRKTRNKNCRERMKQRLAIARQNKKLNLKIY